ncbi:T9SS type A sorting domain-containing protein [candidate division WOR-3 bacterium]|nr:T9SS type A sorting domain-containing protein [candidate division WOR-3 bacterium]
MFLKKRSFILGFVFFAVLLSGAPQDEVTLLKWAGPPGSEPETFREWISSHPYTDLSIESGKMIIGDGRAGTVTIITEQSIASSISNELAQLISNLQQEGYTVLSYQLSGGTPESLRSFLQTLYSSNNIEGALFIGALPIAWYQIENDFSYGNADWPIDLFYMDLDGNWFDTLEYNSFYDSLVPGQDSVYDAHSGNVAPEIYVGRLLPTGIGNDTLLIKNYLTKNNAYRKDTIELQHRALVYVDDDWEYWAPWYAADVALLYSDTLLVSDPETTRATDYRERLDTVRAWVSVFVHSWPAGHQFHYNNYASVDYYMSTEYTSQDPPSNFYNHFACSFARYTTSGYGGGRSIFNQSYGVGEVGSTKTGSMLEFYYFYLPLSQGKTLGEAFKDWFTHIAQGGFNHTELCWHYGMTLLGDPFLKPTGHTTGIVEVETVSRGYSLSLPTLDLFSQEIGIEFGLPKSTHITLRLYDISGRLVRTFYSGFCDKGHHSVTIDRRELRGGIYFIHLESNAFTLARKLIIM